MEGITPSSKDSKNEEVKTNSSIPKSVTSGRYALIVRMPDCRQYRGMRAWIDRREVQEMVQREEQQKQGKVPFKTIKYVEPGDVQITNDMELYFVGHGSEYGFYAQRDTVVDEQQLAEWIKTRRAGNTLVRLRKIKLVTCNSAADRHQIGIFAERLAYSLKGIVTGKVVGFEGFLLSAPDVKATYAQEPLSASLSSEQAMQRFDAMELALRRKMLQEFAKMLMPEEKKIDASAVTWALQVICNNSPIFKARMENYCKYGTSRNNLLELLDNSKCGIRWPSKWGSGDHDLETLIREMKAQNDKFPASTHKDTADKLFKEWKKEIKEKAAVEWDARKKAIVEYYAGEILAALYYFPKSDNQKMDWRREYQIPEP